MAASPRTTGTTGTTRGAAPQPRTAPPEAPPEAPASTPGWAPGLAPWAPWLAQSMSHWQQLTEQLQRGQQQTLQHLVGDVQLEADEAQTLRQPLDLLTLQSTLAAETSAQFAAWTEQVYAACLAFQNQWWQDLEALMVSTLQPWQQGQAPLQPGSVGALICPPEQATPGALLDAATQAWPVAASTMLNALAHDLQAQATSPSVKH